MAIFGRSRDINLFLSVNNELLHDVISQEIGYYKVVLNETEANLYGESTEKMYLGPVLISCLIERGEFNSSTDDFGQDVNRAVKYRFLKNDLINANVVPEIGDVIMYNELYYEIDEVNQNQLILGKDNEYAYSDGLENFGSSWSIIVSTHYARPEKLGITKQRI
jgi:hypothetical protein